MISTLTLQRLPSLSLSVRAAIDVLTAIYFHHRGSLRYLIQNLAIYPIYCQYDITKLYHDIILGENAIL